MNSAVKASNVFGLIFDDGWQEPASLTEVKVRWCSMPRCNLQEDFYQISIFVPRAHISF